MIRPIHSDSLRDSCREVALENHGFLYPDSRELRQKIQNAYRQKSSVQNSWYYSPEPTADQIRSELESFAAGDDRIEQLDETGGYFFDLQDFPEWDQKIVDLFDVRAIVREKELESVIKEEAVVAANDISHIIEKFSSKTGDSYLEVIRAGGTRYYLPGRKLLDQGATRPLADIEDDLSGEAEQEGKYKGTVTRSDIERALEIEAPNKLISKLEERNYLINIQSSERWLVNEDECIADFTRTATKEEIAPRVKRSFSKHDYMLSEDNFSRIVREELESSTGVVRDLGEQHRDEVLTNVEEHVKKLLTDGSSEESLCTRDMYERLNDLPDEPKLDSGPHSKYLVWEPRVQEQVQTEVERLDEIRGDTDPRYFAEHELEDKLRPFGQNDELVKQMYLQRVITQFKQLHKSEQ